jgi:hypothetical protein
MIRHITLLVSFLLFLSTSIAAFADDRMYQIVSFDVTENGSYHTKTIKELGTKEAQLAIQTICWAFEMDCTGVAKNITEAARQLSIQMGSYNGNEWAPAVFAPSGYSVCHVRAFVQSMSDASTMNATVLNADDKGNPEGPYYLAMYFAVPKTNRGENATGHFMIELTPIGMKEQYTCLENKSPIVQCRGQNCSNRDDGYWDGKVDGHKWW